MLGNQNLMSGLRKVWADQSSFCLQQLKTVALAPVKDAGKMVEWAARADAAENSERILIQAMKG